MCMVQTPASSVLLASLAGISAAISAVFSKLAGHVDSSRWSLQLFFYALMVVANLVNLALFSASLRTTSSLRATATAVGSNIVTSGVIGIVLFGEIVSPRWVTGVVLTLLGMILVHPTTKKDHKE